jgi:hypothetical protein
MIAGKVVDQLAPIVLGPHDRLVVVCPATTPQERLNEIKDAADEMGFAGRVLFVAGVEELAVLRGEET